MSIQAVDSGSVAGGDAVPQKKGRRWLVTFGLGLFFIISLISVYQLAYRERIFLGVRLLDIDLGALNREQAQRLLKSKYQGYLDGTLLLRYQDQEWPVTPRKLGVSFTPESTVAEAFGVGRQDGFLNRLKIQAEAVVWGWPLPMAVTMDKAKQDDTLAPIARRIQVNPVGAGLVVENRQVKVIPVTQGVALDGDALSRLLEERFRSLSLEPVELPLAALPPHLLPQDVEEARLKAQRFISSPLTLTFQDVQWQWRDGPVTQVVHRKWTVDEATLANSLRFQEMTTVDGKTTLGVELDGAKLTPFVRRIAQEVNAEPRDARFQWQKGQLTPAVLSRWGQRLDEAALVQRLQTAAGSAERTVEIPVAKTPPTVAMENVVRMGIKEKIEERSTYYGGSIPERAVNVELGAQRLNGVVVAPGQVFSFNQAVGEVSAEAGYQVGFSIVEKETVPDVGGGICQVSTTLFQAIFWAGYPIEERYPHAYRMTRYEEPYQGLDATVYDPYLDLKFRNNTQNYLLIQTRTENQRLYVTLYGTKPSWQVSLEPPRLENVKPAEKEIVREYSSALAKGREVWVEKAEDGVDVTVVRIIQDGGREVRRDRFFSRYRPQRNVLVIGTGPQA
ncbi:MAG: VanW family protein [Chloroflexi bacterium]|nr:VanW family protein [Chloroflexota bacterium]